MTTNLKDEILSVSTKEIAVKASKAVGANENYATIELNFNPEIHIYCYPYKGKDRNLGDKILKALGCIK